MKIDYRGGLVRFDDGSAVVYIKRSPVCTRHREVKKQGSTDRGCCACSFLRELSRLSEAAEDKNEHGG